jgi:hypothetical protein
VTELKLTVPEVGEKNSVADPRTQVALEAIRSFINGEQLNSGNIKPGGIEEASLATAVKTLLNVKASGLTPAAHTVSFTAAGGELAQMETTGITATLPSPVAGKLIGIFVGSAAASAKVTCSSGLIYGDFVNAASTITLASLQHVLLLGDFQETGWLIIAGEPLNETNPGPVVGRTTETEYSPNATRRTFVLLETTGAGELFVGGELIYSGTPGSLSFFCPAGKKWKVKGFSAVASSYYAM